MEIILLERVEKLLDAFQKNDFHDIWSPCCAAPVTWLRKA